MFRAHILPTFPFDCLDENFLKTCTEHSQCIRHSVGCWEHGAEDRHPQGQSGGETDLQQGPYTLSVLWGNRRQVSLVGTVETSE